MINLKDGADPVMVTSNLAQVDKQIGFMGATLKRTLGSCKDCNIADTKLAAMEGFYELHSSHWKIEQYHRVIKQVCHIEKFQVRRSKLILNHIFAALMAYVEIQKNQFERIFENVYRWQKKLFRPIIKDFIDDFILDKNHLLPQRIYK